MSGEELQTPDFIEQMLSDYAPKDQTFSVDLPKGGSLTFRNLPSYGEIAAFKRGYKLFREQLERPSVQKAWEGLIPDNDDDKLAAFTISYLSVEPKFSEQQALKLLSAGWLVNEIMDRIDRSRMAYLSDLSEGIESEKKD